MSDFGLLKDYIVGAAVKRLSDVEVDPDSSNQHELNATKAMRMFLGTDENKFSTTFIRLGDQEDGIEASQGSVTWYDSRKNNPDRSAE